MISPHNLSPLCPDCSVMKLAALFQSASPREYEVGRRPLKATLPFAVMKRVLATETCESRGKGSRRASFCDCMDMHLQTIRKVIDTHSQLGYKTYMIHCVCNNINTAAVDRAAGMGAETAACVQKACGTRFQCGQCKVDIQARLMEVRALAPQLSAAE